MAYLNRYGCHGGYDLSSSAPSYASPDRGLRRLSKPRHSLSRCAKTQTARIRKGRGEVALLSEIFGF